MARQPLPLLEAHGIVGGYAGKRVLRGVSFDIAEREMVAVIGHNGAGKSTLLKALFGLIPFEAGHIALRGKSLGTIDPRGMLQTGTVYVPQGNRVFADFTVKENLELGAVALANREKVAERIDAVMRVFPHLSSRLTQKAGTLSGGEKQQLALGIGLMLKPELLLLDEPTLGLAPTLVRSVLDHINKLRVEMGLSILVVEQKVREALKVANRVLVLKNGEVAFFGSSRVLSDDEKLRDVYL